MPEQIVRTDRLAGESEDAGVQARHLEASEAMLHQWRSQYGGMKADDAKELRELRKENQRLKEIVADKELSIKVLEEIAKGKF